MASKCGLHNCALGIATARGRGTWPEIVARHRHRGRGRGRRSSRGTVTLYRKSLPIEGAENAVDEKAWRRILMVNTDLCILVDGPTWRVLFATHVRSDSAPRSREFSMETALPPVRTVTD